MVKSARREYLKTIRKRYRRARKKDKKPILDEFCTNCGYQRKYAIRLLSLRLKPKVKKPGAQRVWFRSIADSVTFFNGATRT